MLLTVGYFIRGGCSQSSSLQTVVRRCHAFNSAQRSPRCLLVLAASMGLLMDAALSSAAAMLVGHGWSSSCTGCIALCCRFPQMWVDHLDKPQVGDRMLLTA